MRWFNILFKSNRDIRQMGKVEHTRRNGILAKDDLSKLQCFFIILEKHVNHGSKNKTGWHNKYRRDRNCGHCLKLALPALEHYFYLHYCGTCKKGFVKFIINASVLTFVRI